MPIYLVKIDETKKDTVLVDAKNNAAAIRHVVKNLVSAAPVTAAQAIKFVKAGMEVQEAEDAQEQTVQPQENQLPLTE